MDSHINITMDFSNFQANAIFDVRVPAHQTIFKLVREIATIYRIGEAHDAMRCVVRVTNKNMILRAQDVLSAYPITNGDKFVVLK